MTPSNPVLQAMAAAPIAPGIHANSIIALVGNGPIESGSDGVVTYKSAHLEGVDSEYIARSSHSTQSNPYTIEEVHRILLLRAADACPRISCGNPPNAAAQTDRCELAPTRPRTRTPQCSPLLLPLLSCFLGVERSPSVEPPIPVEAGKLRNRRKGDVRMVAQCRHRSFRIGAVR
jgi:hypothetical protein